MEDYREVQRHIAKIALNAAPHAQFALAGSGAIREHGFIDRPTEDIDIFTVASAAEEFEEGVDLVITALRAAGYEITAELRNLGYARLDVISSDGLFRTEIDLGIDWRSQPPIALDIGPVLAQSDAVGNKVAAVFSRGEARDFLDLDSIRNNGSYSDQELLELGARSDLGFDMDMFANSLERAQHLGPVEVADYDYSPEQLQQVQQRLPKFAQQVRDRTVIDEKGV